MPNNNHPVWDVDPYLYLKGKEFEELMRDYKAPETPMSGASCLRCNEDLTLEEYISAGGQSMPPGDDEKEHYLCSYCEHMTSKDD